MPIRTLRASAMDLVTLGGGTVAPQGWRKDVELFTRDDQRYQDIVVGSNFFLISGARRFLCTAREIEPADDLESLCVIAPEMARSALPSGPEGTEPLWPSTLTM